MKQGGGDSEFVFKILPELGYQLNDQWAVGATLGYQKGAVDIGSANFNQNVTTEVFTISPYARYFAFDWDQVSLFFDGGLSFGSYKDMGTYFGLGVSPGVAVKLTDEISFVTHIGFLGFENFSPDGGGKSSSIFGLDFKNSCSFGVYYNF